MSNHVLQTIADLEVRLRAELDVANETKRSINSLCRLAQMPERYPNVGADAEAQPTRIQADTFYGKPLMTAMRDYLLMRKVQMLGAASVNDIHDALTRGGFRFQAKDEENAKAGIRQSLTKNAEVFHKLPNGEYGLLAWYPAAKAARAEPEAPEPRKDSPPARPKSAGGVKPKGKNFGWAQQIDKTLSAAAKPMTPGEIATAILDRNPGFDSPHAEAIVRKNLNEKGAAMGWVKDGGAWKKVSKPGSAQGETRE
jgi:hypothetical protein